MNESKSDTTDDQNIFTEWKIEMSRKFIRRSIFGSKEIDFVFKQVVVNNDKTSVSIAKVFALVHATTAYFKLFRGKYPVLKFPIYPRIFSHFSLILEGL